MGKRKRKQEKPLPTGAGMEKPAADDPRWVLEVALKVGIRAATVKNAAVRLEHALNHPACKRIWQAVGIFALDATITRWGRREKQEGKPPSKLILPPGGLTGPDGHPIGGH